MKALVLVLLMALPGWAGAWWNCNALSVQGDFTVSIKTKDAAVVGNMYFDGHGNVLTDWVKTSGGTSVSEKVELGYAVLNAPCKMFIWQHSQSTIPQFIQPGYSTVTSFGLFPLTNAFTALMDNISEVQEKWKPLPTDTANHGNIELDFDAANGSGELTRVVGQF